MLTFEQIKELIELVSERELKGIEIERSGFRVRIDGRMTVATAVAETVSTQLPVSETSTGLAAPRHSLVAAESAVQPARSEQAVLDGLHLVQSPIVGTFYTSPSPDADPYVQVGERVKKGQVLCIVEAMKLMNEIESDENGVIEQVFPKNAQPVEFGEPLFAIRAD